MSAMEKAYLAELLAELSSALRKRGFRLGTAESCTGGLVSAVCTSLAGSSDWFNGAVVVYSNEMKERLLKVSAGELRDHGAVSPQVARSMALGALDVLDADCSLAVSGVAGPSGGSPEKPVGTVCLAWALRSAAAPPQGTARTAPGSLPPECYLGSDAGPSSLEYMPERRILLGARTSLFSGKIQVCAGVRPDSPRQGIRLAATQSALLGLLELLPLTVKF